MPTAFLEAIVLGTFVLSLLTIAGLLAGVI